MPERDKLPSIPAEDLYGAVQVVTDEELMNLRARYQGKKFDRKLLHTGHDSQAGERVSYGGTILFLEADNSAFNYIQATKLLLGLS